MQIRGNCVSSAKIRGALPGSYYNKIRQPLQIITQQSSAQKKKLKSPTLSVHKTVKIFCSDDETCLQPTWSWGFRHETTSYWQPRAITLHVRTCGQSDFRGNDGRLINRHCKRLKLHRYAKHQRMCTFALHTREVILARSGTQSTRGGTMLTPVLQYR